MRHHYRLISSNVLQTSMRFISSMSAPIVNYYKRLEVNSNATTDELKSAYRRRALVCHPDVVENNEKAQAEVEFRAISEAYDVLMDPQRRAEHDKALGIQHSMESKEKKEATFSSSSSSSFSSSKTTSTTNSKTSENINTTRRRKPFVRGDADRKFREAFHGMSLDQIIFQERLRQRQMQRDQQQKFSSSSSSSSFSEKENNKSSNDSPAGYEESLRRVVADAAERFAAKLQRQYGPGMLKHVKLYSNFSDISQKSSPPSNYMPFRPFHGCSAPHGVRTPPEPTLGNISHVNNEEVIMKEEEKKGVEGIMQYVNKRNVPKQFPVVRAMNGSMLSRSEAARYLERERNSPYNMGKLYSYHRPY